MFVSILFDFDAILDILKYVINWCSIEVHWLWPFLGWATESYIEVVGYLNNLACESGILITAF